MAAYSRIISINASRIGDKDRVEALKAFIMNIDPAVILLQEIDVSSALLKFLST